MYTLSQEGLTLCAEGPRLWLEDSRRGQRWTLDPASGWSGRRGGRRPPPPDDL